MNPHGYTLQRDPNEQTRRRICPHCMTTEFTQTTALIVTEEGATPKWLPALCSACTRRTMRNGESQ